MKPPSYQTFVIPLNLASSALPTETQPVGRVALLLADAGGARRRTDIAAGTKHMQKARLPAIHCDTGICWRAVGCHTGSSACLVGDPIYAPAYNRNYPIECRMSKCICSLLSESERHKRLTVIADKGCAASPLALARLGPAYTAGPRP